MQPSIQDQAIFIEGKRYAASTLEVRCREAKQSGRQELLDVVSFLKEWFAPDSAIAVQTSGSTGKPKRLFVQKEYMMQSARMTCQHLHLHTEDTALLCMNLHYIGAKMMLVRALLLGMNVVVRPASGHPLADVHEPISFAAMVPLQVYNTLAVPTECERLRQINRLIIGGGALEQAMECRLSTFPTAVYATYGMTETLSHIALRRVNGPHASPYYTPMEGVQIWMGANGTLEASVPAIGIDLLQTNDLIHLNEDGTFALLGRIDNVINSGGIKIVAEELETLLAQYIAAPLAVTAVPDAFLGEALVLFVESMEREIVRENLLKEKLPPYKYPKKVIYAAIPRTPNGKIDRNELKQCAFRYAILSEGDTYLFPRNEGK